MPAHCRSMHDRESTPRGLAWVRIIVGLAALLMAWLTEPADVDAPATASHADLVRQAGEG